MKYKIKRKIGRSPVFHCVYLQSTFWYKFYTCACVHVYTYTHAHTHIHICLFLYMCSWCWRRLLRDPWTERRSNYSILKEINPEYSLEVLLDMTEWLNWTDAKAEAPILGHLMWRANSLEKTLMLGKVEDRKRWGRQRQRWLDGITDSKTWVWADSGTEWKTGKPGVLQSMGLQRVGHNLVTEQQPQRHIHMHNYTGIHICSLLLFSYKYGILLPKFFIQLCINIMFPCL